jgi:SAM-dependent methyltransferase
MDFIDWDEQWKAAKNNSGLSSTINMEQWDSMAPTLRRWMVNDGYVGKFVKRIRLRPEWTVLDVGCGPGDISIWAARRSRQVTAVDISEKMIDILKDSACREGLSNIVCMQRSWCDDGMEPGRHDIVIASRSLGTMPGLRTALSRIDKAAGRYAYVTMGDGLIWPLKRIMCDATGRECGGSPGYIYAYNLLYQMGIRANISFIDGRSTFLDMDDVIGHCRWMAGSLDRVEEKAISRALAGILVKKNGGLQLPYNDLRWALIWWKK